MFIRKSQNTAVQYVKYVRSPLEGVDLFRTRSLLSLVRFFICSDTIPTKKKRQISEFRSSVSEVYIKTLFWVVQRRRSTTNMVK